MGLFKKNKIEEKQSYMFGLDKTRKSFKDKIKSLFSGKVKLDDDFFESLEEMLIGADCGASLSIKIIESLKEECKLKKVSENQEVIKLLEDKLINAYTNNDDFSLSLNYSNTSPTVILVMGVNGVGKTTSIAKLAYKFKKENKKVLLVAGDTFRAGAVEQLNVWADRIGVDILIGKENGDPSGVIYDGVKKGVDEKYDVVLCDTAGRLQNKENLMNEASKVVRTIKKIVPEAPHEFLLVIDATTGQNGVYQAKSFNEISDITGIVLTKLDGTSKGGIILAIKDQLNIPVKFVGLGEKIEDLREFDLPLYIESLLEE